MCETMGFPQTRLKYLESEVAFDANFSFSGIIPARFSIKGLFVFPIS